MVTGFRRSISLPGSSPNSPGRPTKSRAPEKSYHVRSISLPCRSHPIISRVEDEIRALRAWQSRPETESGDTAAWLGAGLTRLELLHASMGDLLQLPQSQDSLRRGSSWTERLLDDYLHLADAHGTFRSAVVALKQNQSAARVAVRRGDEARLASCVSSQRRAEKELTKLASSLRNVAKPLSSATGFASDAGEAELAGIWREVAAVTASASVSLFLGISAASSATTMAAASSPRAAWMVGPLRKLSSSTTVASKEEEEEKRETWRTRALESLEGMEEWVGALESISERVFRSLLNTRVSLLNILTPSF